MHFKQQVDVLEVKISSGIELDLLSLAKLLHYISGSKSIIEYDDSLNYTVDKSEYLNIIKVNNISPEFISILGEVVGEYRECYGKNL